MVNHGFAIGLGNWGKQKWGASGIGVNKMVGQALPSPKYSVIHEGKSTINVHLWIYLRHLTHEWWKWGTVNVICTY
jgi:hypothetical protein